MKFNRYETIMQVYADRGSQLAAHFVHASIHARQTVDVRTRRERDIRDVAAAVAAPALITYVLWLWQKAERERRTRIYFLSRDGQVLLEIARLLELHHTWPAEARYLFSSRRTWSLAASDASALEHERWLFNSFMRSNASDLCDRLGVSFTEYTPLLVRSGISLDPNVRNDRKQQREAFARFLREGAVQDTMAVEIRKTQELLVAYVRQEGVADDDALLVDVGWTGRMLSALAKTLRRHGLTVPPATLWALQPSPRLVPEKIKIEAFMYDTARHDGLARRIPDTPFVVESFCMADHGTLSGYWRDTDGLVRPRLSSDTNPGARRWGLAVHRAAISAVCDALRDRHRLDDLREMVSELLSAFWLHPTRAEAMAWGMYPYDSDPTGSAARPLARPFPEDVQDFFDPEQRGDRAWLAGSVALSPASVRSRWDSQDQGERLVRLSDATSRGCPEPEADS